MEEETMENQSNNNTMYYVLGAIVLVAVIAAGYLLRPKTSTQTPVVQQQAAAPVATPTLGPITRLGCDYQYYNPVIGFPKYYLSAQGGDVTGPSSVECTMTFTQANQVVGTQTITSPLTAAPERSGSSFKCTTPGVELKSSVPTKVDVVLKDDQGAKATCSAVFTLPKS